MERKSRQELLDQLETALRCLEPNNSNRMEEILNELDRILERRSDDDDPYSPSNVPRKPKPITGAGAVALPLPEPEEDEFDS